MTAMLLIIVSATASLLEGITVKKYSAKHAGGGFVFTALISAFALLFFLVRNGGRFHLSAALWGFGVAAGIAYAVASFSTYLAFGYGSFAMPLLLFSYSLILPIGYGLIFLREPVTICSCIGFVVMLVSLYLVREKRQRRKADIRKMAVGDYSRFYRQRCFQYYSANAAASLFGQANQ